MAQHNLDSGTALRAFEARAREKSNAIRASLELGLISADPRLAATITAFQICLDDVISSLSLAIRTGNDVGYQDIDTATKSYWVAMNQRLYSDTPIWDQVTGERRIVRRPFDKLSMYVNNLAVSVGAANVVSTEDKTEPAKPFFRIPGLKRPGSCVRYISANAGASDHDEADRSIAIQKYDQFASLLKSIDSVLEEILWPMPPQSSDSGAG